MDMQVRYWENTKGTLVFAEFYWGPTTSQRYLGRLIFTRSDWEKFYASKDVRVKKVART